MKISDFLAPENALVDISSSDKPRLLRDLSDRATASVGLPADMISAALLKREALGSTGLGSGVAIPHARLADLRTPFGALVRLRKPMDFEAIDGQPVDIVFLLLLPEARGQEQLNVLALVARTLRTAEICRLLRQAPDSAGLYRSVVGT